MNSLFTHAYRGGFIHGGGDTGQCRWQYGDVSGESSTYRAAQLRLALMANVTGRVSADNPAVEAIEESA